MIQVNRIYLIFNRLVTKKFLVDTSDVPCKVSLVVLDKWGATTTTTVTITLKK